MSSAGVLRQRLQFYISRSYNVAQSEHSFRHSAQDDSLPLTFEGGEDSLIEMTEIIRKDAGGAEFKVLNFQGHILPRFPLEAVSSIRTATLRDDDIIVSGFPKSGNHWIYEVCRLLVAGEITEDSIGKSVNTLLKRTPDKYENLPSPRILSTHVCVDLFPDDLLKRKPKIVQVLRNPKDLSVSMYHFVRILTSYYDYKGEWKDFLKTFTEDQIVYGSWFDHVKGWEDLKAKHPELPVLTVFYEDAKEDLSRETKRIHDFLSLDRTDEFIQQVSRHSGFLNMKKLKSTDEIVSVLFRKGEVGDWKNWFTVAQNEWFDKHYQEKMAGCHLTFKYAL